MKKKNHCTIKIFFFQLFNLQQYLLNWRKDYNLKKIVLAFILSNFFVHHIWLILIYFLRIRLLKLCKGILIFESSHSDMQRMCFLSFHFLIALFAYAFERLLFMYITAHMFCNSNGKAIRHLLLWNN